MPLLADVAVPVPLTQSFTYEVPASMADSVKPGARVVCELGRRRVIGVVLGASEREPPEGVHLKPIGRIVDAEPVLPEELLHFLQELASYYFAPIGEVLRVALPALEREQVREMQAQGELPSMSRVKQVGGKRIQYARPTDAIEPDGTLRGQAAAVLKLLRASGEQPVARLEKQLGNARQAVKKLISLGLVTTEEHEPPRDPFFATPEARDEAPELNEAQAIAAAAIEEALERSGSSSDQGASGAKGAAGPHDPSAFLLFGVTGSGKTEVYLRAIAACLARGRGALVMVPEIALTPQLVARFRARFGDELAVLHSGLTDADRHAMWSSLREGRVHVAIGARSALFAPVESLGLVIVDEEHDASFKQEEGVRYHARDMALLRAYRARAVAVLGSATPSLESIALVRRGKLSELRLPERAHHEATLPTVTLIDIRRIGAGPTGNRLISIPLHRAIDATLAAGEQSILFLNRRGFAPSVVCDSCGAVETCLACSVALTYHRPHRRRGAGAPAAREAAPDEPLDGTLRCHYCDHVGPLPDRCSACRADALLLEGLGTERLEDTIAEAFPKARIARLDRDVANPAQQQKILDRMRSGEVDILVGTQMVTKGHDLPNVTLVGVVNADAALSMPDFRASERGFQLLVQVAGRAGRHDRPGRVLIQTRTPDHPSLRFAAKHDVNGFLEHEMRDRQEVGYPPFTRLALFRIDAVDEHVAREAAVLLASRARASGEARARRVDVLGPAAAPIARLRGRYRFRVLLRGKERAPLRSVIAAAAAARASLDNRVRVVIDVDPVAML